MLGARRILLLGIVLLAVLLHTKPGYAIAPPPTGFVAVTGPHGIIVLIGPLQISPSGGYEREVIVPGHQPFMVSTEPAVTPQEIANVYG